MCTAGDILGPTQTRKSKNSCGTEYKEIVITVVAEYKLLATDHSVSIWRNILKLQSQFMTR